MSSTFHQEQIDPADLVVIRDVLRTEGFRGVKSLETSEAKRAASAFLHAQFYNGNRTRESLLLALQTQQRTLHQQSSVQSPWKSGAFERWQDEGGQ
jgi:hypothetical protein